MTKMNKFELESQLGGRGEVRYDGDFQEREIHSDEDVHADLNEYVDAYLKVDFVEDDAKRKSM